MATLEPLTRDVANELTLCPLWGALPPAGLLLGGGVLPRASRAGTLQEEVRRRRDAGRSAALTFELSTEAAMVRLAKLAYLID